MNNLTAPLDLERQENLRVFHNSSSMIVEYPFGHGLARKIIPSTARYQADKLYHSQGHLACAWDSDVYCEMWRYVHMNQHLGHECKLARFAGDSKEAYRVMKHYFAYFKKQ